MRKQSNLLVAVCLLCQEGGGGNRESLGGNGSFSGEGPEKAEGRNKEMHYEVLIDVAL